jgi:hypothetical protein
MCRKPGSRRLQTRNLTKGENCSTIFSKANVSN